jgi:glycine hydroxymethyltransferase
MIVAGASAYPRFFDFEALPDIARSVDALLMVDMAHIAGLVAAGLHPSPMPHSRHRDVHHPQNLARPAGGIDPFGMACGKKINSQVFPGIQGGPLMHVIAAKAVAFKEALGDAFSATKNRDRNAADPCRSADEPRQRPDLVSGGTDNHLMLVNLTNLGITGREAEEALGRPASPSTKMRSPFETRSPAVTSGIRIGTPFVTSRGMMAEQMKVIGSLMAEVLRNPENGTAAEKNEGSGTGAV